MRQAYQIQTFPSLLTLQDLCRFLWNSLEHYDDQLLRIEIRGRFRDIWTREPLLLLDWHFLKSWSERFAVLGLFPLPFNEYVLPWPDVRYLLYDGPCELRFWLAASASGEQRESGQEGGHDPE